MVKNIFGFNSKNFGMPRKRDIQRQINPFKRVREPIPAKKRKELLEKAKYTCQFPGCKIKQEGDIKLEVHHINMKNDDNRLSNLMVLCANHHRAKHNQEKRIIKKDPFGYREIRSRVVSKEKTKELKKKNKDNINNPFNFPKPKKIKFGF